MKPKPESYLEYHAKMFADYDRKKHKAFVGNDLEGAQRYLNNQLHHAWAIINMILEDDQK